MNHKNFMTQRLTPLGINEAVKFSENGRMYATDAGAFLVLRPANGEEATYANGAEPLVLQRQMRRLLMQLMLAVLLMVEVMKELLANDQTRQVTLMVLT